MSDTMTSNCKGSGRPTFTREGRTACMRCARTIGTTRTGNAYPHKENRSK